MHLALGTAMAAFAEAEFDAIVPVEMEALIAALTINAIINAYGLDRTAGDTLEALLSDFVQAQLFF